MAMKGQSNEIDLWIHISNDLYVNVIFLNISCVYHHVFQTERKKINLKQQVGAIYQFSLVSN
jgi:hypothetical protein